MKLDKDAMAAARIDRAISRPPSDDAKGPSQEAVELAMACINALPICADERHAPDLVPLLDSALRAVEQRTLERAAKLMCGQCAQDRPFDVDGVDHLFEDVPCCQHRVGCLARPIRSEIASPKKLLCRYEEIGQCECEPQPEPSDSAAPPEEKACSCGHADRQHHAPRMLDNGPLWRPCSECRCNGGSLV